MATMPPASYNPSLYNSPSQATRPAAGGNWQSYYSPASASGFPQGVQASNGFNANRVSSMPYGPSARPVQAAPMARVQAYASTYTPWGNGNNGAINPYAQAQAGFASPQRALTAQEMGMKVGTLVSNFLQGNPLLLQKLNNIDLDGLEQDLGPKVEKQRARIQQNIIRRLPQRFDERLVGLLDPEFQQLGREGIQWLRKDPDAATLAQIQTDALTEPASASWTSRIKDKVKSVWPFSRNKSSGQNNQEAANIQDLEALLNSLPTTN